MKESTSTLLGDRSNSHRVERDALKAFREVLRMFSEEQTVEVFREGQRAGAISITLASGPSEMHGR
jgi:hypothetical protein